MKRWKFKLFDFLIIGVIAAAAAVSFALFAGASRGDSVTVTKNGEAIALLNLSVQGEYDFAGENGISLHVSVQDGAARVVSSGCDDQLCVRSGGISKAGSAIICLPAKTTLVVNGGNGADAYSY